LDWQRFLAKASLPDKNTLMSASFTPPDWLVYHEVGHALMSYSQRIGIKHVSVDMFYISGYVGYQNPAVEMVGYICSIAGPIAQQIFVPDSITDPRLKGLLFDPAMAANAHHWSAMESAVAAIQSGWTSDLKNFYTSILNPPLSCAARVAPFAKAEEINREFFRNPQVIEAAHALACRLRLERSMEGAEAEATLEPFFSTDTFLGPPSTPKLPNTKIEETEDPR
jgi:hypothetical protein